MINLISKDLKLLFFAGTTQKERILNLIFRLLFIGIVLAFEIFLFRGVLLRVIHYDGASQSFLILFLFVVMILMILFSLIQADKLLFDERDRSVSRTLPIAKDTIVFEKVIFLLLLQLFADLLVAYPLLCTFAALVHKMPFFYFQSLFYCLASSFFEVGVALLLVYPFHKCKVFLADHILVEFILSLVLLFSVSLLYGRVLSLFLELVNNNELETLFSQSEIENLNNITSNFYPVSLFLSTFMNNSTGWEVIYSLLVFVAIFFLGSTVASLAYNSFIEESRRPVNKKKKEEKILTPTKALIRKEISLLVRSPDYIFSFTGLLVLAPFLSYLIINAMNQVFRSGLMSYYISLFPSFLTFLDLILLFFIYSTILSGGDNYIGIEKNNVKTMKILPLSPLKQLAIKVSIPYLLSLTSLLVTALVLSITKEISFLDAFLMFLYVSLYLAIISLVSLYEELKRKRNGERDHLLSSLYSYVLPLVILLLSYLLSFYRVPLYGIHLLSFALLLLSSLPFVIHLKKRTEVLFLSLEVNN